SGARPPALGIESEPTWGAADQPQRSVQSLNATPQLSRSGWTCAAQPCWQLKRSRRAFCVHASWALAHPTGSGGWDTQGASAEQLPVSVGPLPMAASNFDRQLLGSSLLVQNAFFPLGLSLVGGSVGFVRLPF